ncbi:MAG: hypothetical protein OEQ13_01330 [Acidobacteriota bacterium]|nr:hypothetical protein [Acidobacteriota bacterium]
MGPLDPASRAGVPLRDESRRLEETFKPARPRHGRERPERDR